MSEIVKVGDLAKAVMQKLEEYQDVTEDNLREAVLHAGKTIRGEIKETAPIKTGAYRKSWAMKTTNQGAHKIEVTVYSRNKYQLAHLLEHGHALRGGGRARAFPHIKPAEEKGIRQLEEEIKRSLRNG